MPIDNFLSIVLTEEEENALQKAVDTINQILKEKVVSLTPTERQKYGNVSDLNKLLIDKCKDYMEQNPEIIPHVVDKNEFDRDYKVRKQLEQSIRSFTRIIEKLKDTKTLVDHDNYHAAVAYYRYIKFLSSQNEPGVTSIYQDLQKHYKHASAKKEPTADATNTQE